MRTHADNSSLLIFLHIPKNGGSTLNNIIRRQYPGQSVFWFSYERPELIRFSGETLDEVIQAEGEGYPKELRKLHAVNHTLYMLSNTWKRVLPPALRNYPGIRHVRVLAHKLLG